MKRQLHFHNKVKNTTDGCESVVTLSLPSEENPFLQGFRCLFSLLSLESGQDIRSPSVGAILGRAKILCYLSVFSDKRESLGADTNRSLHDQTQFFRQGTRVVGQETDTDIRTSGRTPPRLRNEKGRIRTTASTQQLWISYPVFSSPELSTYLHSVSVIRSNANSHIDASPLEFLLSFHKRGKVRFAASGGEGARNSKDCNFLTSDKIDNLYVHRLVFATGKFS